MKANKIKTILIGGNPFQYVPILGSDGSEFKSGDVALNGRSEDGGLWLRATYNNGDPKKYSSWEVSECVDGLDAEEILEANLELTAEQPLEPNWCLFLAFAIANIPDVNTRQVIELFNKIEASNWIFTGEVVDNWREWALPEIKKLDRVQHTIYNLPMHQTIELPEIKKQVTRVAHGLIYESLTYGLSDSKILSNPIYIPIKGEYYDTYCNNPEVVKLIESEKQRIRKNMIDKKG